MILKEFINYEKSIENKYLSIRSVEDIPKQDEMFETDKPFYVFFNLGNLITVVVDDELLLCPPKHGFIGLKKGIRVVKQPNKVYKFTIVEVKKRLKKELKKRFIKILNEEYEHITLNKDFVFNFTLNTNIIEQLECIYKIDENLPKKFFHFEIEIQTKFFFSEIFKKALLCKCDIVPDIATQDTKYHYILNDLIKENEDFEQLLERYGMSKELFFEKFDHFNNISFDSYLEEVI